MAVVVVLLLLFFLYLLFSSDSNSSSSTSPSSTQQPTPMSQNTTTSTTTASTAAAYPPTPGTIGEPIAHCNKAALFLNWLNPSIALVLFLAGLAGLCCLGYFVGDHVARRLRDLTDTADDRIRQQKRAAEAAAEATRAQAVREWRVERRALKERGRGGFLEFDVAESAYADGEDAASDGASDTDTMVDGRSPSPARTLKQEEERLLATDPVNEEPVIERQEEQQPLKPRPAMSAMTPEEIRKLSHLLIQTSLVTFGLLPLVVFLLCLLVNNATFCTIYYAPYPGYLWYMLWALVPGYIVWSGFVVVIWGQALAVILGREKETRRDDVVELVPWLLACVLQPVPILVWVVGKWLYCEGVERLYHYGVGVMERRIMRGQDQYRPPGEGDTMLLPLHRTR